MSKGIIQAIRQRIMNSEDGSFFFNSDFWDIASPETVRQSLLRLTKEKLIRKLGRGMYEKPKMNEHFQLPMPPNPVKMAHSIAKNKGWTITMEGNYGLNKLGLSTQVPGRYFFVTDGPNKVCVANKRTLTFIHRVPKDITNLSSITALTIEALKIGKRKYITEKDVRILKHALIDEHKNTINDECGKASEWIQNIIKEVQREVNCTNLYI